MNEPMNHRGYVFYQSNYVPDVDPRTDRPTGRFQSVFHVGYDPGRFVKYLGCCLVVFGAFVQFYMRSGVFNAPKLVGQWVSKVGPHGHADAENSARAEKPRADVEEAL